MFKEFKGIKSLGFIEAIKIGINDTGKIFEHYIKDKDESINILNHIKIKSYPTSLSSSMVTLFTKSFNYSRKASQFLRETLAIYL